MSSWPDPAQSIIPPTPLPSIADMALPSFAGQSDAYTPYRSQSVNL
jgi:hypothetical protein